MNKDTINNMMKMIVPIVFVLVTFQWTPNSEPDMSHYELYQRVNNVTTVINSNIPHPTSTVSIDISESNLRDGAFYLKAVDTEGFKSDPSDEATCDVECIAKYLEGGEIKNIVITNVERKL